MILIMNGTLDPWNAAPVYDLYMGLEFPHYCTWKYPTHYNDVIMSAMASQITSLTIIFSAVYSGTDQRKHQSSVSLAFVRGSHRWPVNSPHKGPVTRKCFHLMTSWCTCWLKAISRQRVNCTIIQLAFIETMAILLCDFIRQDKAIRNE